MSGVEIFDPTGGADTAVYLREDYGEAGAGSRSAALVSYYRLKPLLPRSLQLAMRRVYARKQAQREFPRWPVETVLVERMHDRLRERIATAGDNEFEFVWFWPEGRWFAAVMTHDVEGPDGIANIDRVLEVEQRHGIVSSWNFCGDWYPIPDGVFDRLREAGCEIGVHGITHDDYMWRNRENFEETLPKLQKTMRDWGSEGVRSPATHRNAAWMHELGASYDSSFPDTDPFEPIAGGCCSIFPFFFGDVVELPITLVQDHTLWEILRRDGIETWTDKADWIAANHGLVNLILHPDYVIEPERLARYDAFLSHLCAQEEIWLALPRDVAEWWRRRAGDGIGAPGAVAAHARDEGGRIVLGPQS